jgi:hypothetical protein
MAQKQIFKYKFSCSNCNQNWSGDNINKLSKKIAWHWNKKHHDNLRHSYEKIYEKVIGGHHVHENEHVVEKIPIYITSFDVADKLGQEDSYAVLSDTKIHCEKCMEIMDADCEGDKTICSSCKYNIKIQNIKQRNHQLDEFGNYQNA